MNINRRTFLSSSLLLSVYAIKPKRLYAKQNNNSSFVLSKNQFAILNKIQNQLFPKGDDNPSIDEINATEYMQKVLIDELYDKDIRLIIFNGIDKLERQSIAKYHKSISKLKDENMELLLKEAKEEWAEPFLAMVLLFIFEALFSDPIYGSNTNERGWKWINHQQGQPQPNNNNLYKPLAQKK